MRRSYIGPLCQLVKQASSNSRNALVSQIYWRSNLKSFNLAQWAQSSFAVPSTILRLYGPPLFVYVHGNPLWSCGYDRPTPRQLPHHRVNPKHHSLSFTILTDILDCSDRPGWRSVSLLVSLLGAMLVSPAMIFQAVSAYHLLLFFSPILHILS